MTRLRLQRVVVTIRHLVLEEAILCKMEPGPSPLRVLASLNSCRIKDLIFCNLPYNIWSDLNIIPTFSCQGSDLSICTDTRTRRLHIAYDTQDMSCYVPD
jgi:hypothetical protein